MAKYVRTNNSRALDVVNTYKDALYSFLMADPSKPTFNHISTIPVAERNDNNGYANFLFCYQDTDIGLMQKLNVRVETWTFNDTLLINSNKVAHLQKCDMLIFPGEENSLYVSVLDNFGSRKWLTDKSNFSRKTFNFNGKQKTYNIYNLRKITDIETSVFELVYSADKKNIIVIKDYKFMLSSDEKLDTRVFKPLVNYNIDTSHIKFVQYDAKVSSIVFWCFGKDRYTNNIASTTKLAAYLTRYTDNDASSIYQQILRAYKKTIETGKAYSFKLPAKSSMLNDIAFDPSIFDKDNNITIYISDSDTFDVIENKVENITDNINAYQRAYQKVRLWIKRNPGKAELPSKWTEEEKELALKLINK